MSEIIIAERAGEIADVATRKSVSEADIMLMETAEKGDAFALEVFKKLPHDVKVKIVNEGDFTKPTFSGLLATPEEVVNIFVSDPSIWVNLGHMDIDERIIQIRIMCTSLILSHDTDKWFGELFQAIEENESAVLYLAAAFVGCVEQDVENEEFHFSFIKSQYGDGEISHVHQMLRLHAPNLERQVAEAVCGFGEDSSYGATMAMLVELQEQSKAQAMAETFEAEGVDL